MGNCSWGEGILLSSPYQFSLVILFKITGMRTPALVYLHFIANLGRQDKQIYTCISSTSFSPHEFTFLSNSQPEGSAVSGVSIYTRPETVACFLPKVVRTLSVTVGLWFLPTNSAWILHRLCPPGRQPFCAVLWPSFNPNCAVGSFALCRRVTRQLGNQTCVMCVCSAVVKAKVPTAPSREALPFSALMLP